MLPLYPGGKTEHLARCGDIFHGRELGREAVLLMSGGLGPGTSYDAQDSLLTTKNYPVPSVPSSYIPV